MTRTRECKRQQHASYGAINFSFHNWKSVLMRQVAKGSSKNNATKSTGLILVSAVAVVFGVLTIKEGGMVLLGDAAARTDAGDYVPFVLWFNFLAGFAYVIAGTGLWLQRRWAAWLAVVIAAATSLTFAAFGAHVLSGGAYEQRTVIAMSLRTLVWIAIAAISFARTIRRSV